jgi:hypothetical protein
MIPVSFAERKRGERAQHGDDRHPWPHDFRDYFDLSNRYSEAKTASSSMSVV